MHIFTQSYSKLLYLLIIILIPQFGSSKSIIDSLRIELKDSKSIHDEINTLLIIGTRYCDINTDSAIAFINKAENKLNENPDPFLFGEYHKAYGMYLKRTNKYNSAITEYKTAITYFAELDSTFYIAFLYNYIATSFKELIEYDSALLYFQLSTQLTDTIKNPSLQAANYNNLALVFDQMDQQDKALINYFKALTIFRRLNKFKQAAVTLNNIGILNLDIGNIEKAIVYFEEAISNSKKSEDVYNLCLCYNNIGTAYKNLSDYNKAKYYLMEAYRLSERAGFMEFVAQSSANLGVLYEHILDYDSALLFYNKSLNICEEIGIIHGEIINDINVGNIYMNMGQYEDAEKSLLMAIDLSETHNINSFLTDIYRSLFESYQLSGNYKKSVDYFRLYDALKDSLDIIERTRQLNELQTKYETEQKDLENLQLRDKNKINELIIMRQRVVMGTISLIIILTIAIIILLIRAKSTRKRRIALLEEKNEQIEDKSLQLKASNETKDKLFSIIAHDLRSPFNSLLGFASLLDEDVNSGDYSNIKTYSKQLVNASESAYELVDNLLGWARLQQAMIKPSITEISLNELCNNTIKTLLPKANQKQITIKVSIDSSIKANCDSNMLMVVLRNLLSNAIKFTQKMGIVEVGCNVKTNHYELFVKDNGYGIDKELKNNLFKNINGVSTSGTDGERGSGLGLLLVKDFIDKLGGEVWVESKPNEGSTFCFTIPK